MTMFSQDQVNQWFGANPNATPQQVAQTVQGIGGLDANPGLAGMIGQHYGTDATTVSDLYSQILGRAPDEGGLSYWNNQFGDTVDANELATFKAAAAPELAMSNYQAPAAPTAPYSDIVEQWTAKNPNATQSQITQAIQDAGGLTPDFANAVAKHYGTTAEDVTSQYQTNQGINNLYQTYLGRAPESQDVVNQWAKQFGSTIDPEEIAAFRQAAAPELAQTHYLSTPMRGDIQQYVSGVLADNSLSNWEKTNKIMEQAQKSGITQSQIEDVYGKQNVQPYMDTYKSGITDYINKALATDPTKTTFDEVGQIHQAAAKYGLTPEEVAKYSGMDAKQIKSYFDAYDQGLGTILSRLNDPKVDDLTKTQTTLALQQKYGATDAELAKASGGKYTEKDIKAYLDPVRNVPTNLQKLFDDPNATAADITKFITEAKADPRAAGIYGAALDKVAASTPDLFLRDVVNANDSGESAQKFLAAAKATPELATKYANQIKAVEQVLAVNERAKNKDWGGTVPDFAMQMFLGLDKGTISKAPTQLELSKPEVKTGLDDNNNQYTYTTQPTVKTKGAIADTDGEGNITGYRVPVDSKAFGNADPKINVASANKPLYAVYDANGKRTGFESADSVFTSDQTYYRANFDANGAPKPQAGVSRGGGFLKNTVQDIASMGLGGQLALMAATGGLGSLAAGALASSLGPIAAQMVGSGLVGGVMSNVAGGDFGKGFVAGGAGAGASALANGIMPTGGFNTGSPMVDSYLAKALPNAAGAITSAGISGADMSNAGLYSLLNTGVNMGTNSLLKDSPISTLPTSAQPYATGIASNLISSILSNQNPNVQNAIMRTIGQQAMQAGKSAVKP